MSMEGAFGGLVVCAIIVAPFAAILMAFWHDN